MAQNYLVLKRTHSKKNSHRGVADVISTLMLVMVTVVGSTSIVYFLNDGFVTSTLGAVENLDSTTKTITLVSYDARDSYNLLSISHLNNTIPTDGFLCGISCKDNPKKLPANQGTEFIIIQLKNDSIHPIWIHELTINNIQHYWDNIATGPLDIQNQLPTGNYPESGKFSIFDPDDSQMNLFDDNLIESGDTTNLLIKLDTEIPDISLGKGIRILVNIGEPQLEEFIIYGGEAR